MKVLIVDDSAYIRDWLRTMISDMTALSLVGEAQSADEAIQSVQRLQPDVVILDIEMPGGSGFEVLRHVRAANLPIKVLLFSNYSDPIHRKAARELGADHLFDKSTEFEKLTETLLSLAGPGG